MRVLSVASEIYPLIKTGGLADVAGALPAALARKGVAVRTLVPGYPAVLEKLVRQEVVHRFADLFGGPAISSQTRRPTSPFVIDAPNLYARSQSLHRPERTGWPEMRSGCRAFLTSQQKSVQAPKRFRPTHPSQIGRPLSDGRSTLCGDSAGAVLTVHNLA